MQERPRVLIVGMAGLGLLTALHLRLVLLQAPAAALRGSSRPLRLSRTPSAEARHAGWRGWIRAQQRVARELEEIEAWDPAATAGGEEEALRRQWLACDRGGDLRTARRHALRAVALARNLDEIFEATGLLARLACDLGDHRAELTHAERLIDLASRDPVPVRQEMSLLVLRRARNHLERLHSKVVRNNPRKQSLLMYPVTVMGRKRTGEGRESG